MRRTSTLSTALAVVLLLVLTVDAQRQEPRRPAAPMLTSEDVLSSGAGHSIAEESVSRTSLSGSPLRNPLGVLEGALTNMGEVNSVRTRLQTSLPTGQTEFVIESMKPDRMHVISSYGEMIAIGRKFYVKSAGVWQIQSAPVGGAQSEVVFDFRTFLKQMMAKMVKSPGVRITGQVLGGQMIDGVETVVYEFAVTDASETGTVQICIGKADGYMRRMFLLGKAVEIKIWYTGINEQFSIEPPM